MTPPTFFRLPDGRPLLAVVSTGPDLPSAGYCEREYRVSGSAARFASATGGTGQIVTLDRAHFATRVLVRAPADPAQHSGLVVVEWFNVSSGSDAAPDYTYLAEEIVRRGHAWVGISAQMLGVVGGQPTIGGDHSPGLRGADPARYGELTHPGDAYSYDIFTQVANALTRAGAPLAGYPVRQRIAVGESQSAFALTTYLNVVAPVAGAFDGYLVHSRGRAELGLGEAGRPADLGAARSAPPVTIRDDIDVPVLVVQTETDVLGPRFRYVDARQPDRPWFRLWEVAGTSHADLWQIGDLESLLGCPEPVNRGQQAYVLRAALRALEEWHVDGGDPPIAERLAVVVSDPPRFEVDELGIARGGIRTPCVETPAQLLTGLARADASVLCSLFGATRDLPREAIRARYPSADRYLEEYAAATDRMIVAGFAVPEDRDALLAEAMPGLVTAALD